MGHFRGPIVERERALPKTKRRKDAEEKGRERPTSLCEGLCVCACVCGCCYRRVRVFGALGSTAANERKEKKVMSLRVLVSMLPAAPCTSCPPCFPSLCSSSLFFLSLPVSCVDITSKRPSLRLLRTRNRTRARKAPSGVFVMPIAFSVSLCIPQRPFSSLCVSFFWSLFFFFGVHGFCACACMSVYVHIRMCVRRCVSFRVSLPHPRDSFAFGVLVVLSLCLSLALFSRCFSSPLSCRSIVMFFGAFSLFCSFPLHSCSPAACVKGCALIVSVLA